jgi:putative polyhydroxyalkanoate system protein
MPDIHIHRPHALGLPRAREVAEQWADKARRKFGMACHWGEGDRCDTLAFAPQGVSGQVVVSAGHFELDARLGFLLKAFAPTIEHEIRKNLDELLEGDGGGGSPAQAEPGAARPGPAKTPGRR